MRPGADRSHVASLPGNVPLNSASSTATLPDDVEHASIEFTAPLSVLWRGYRARRRCYRGNTWRQGHRQAWVCRQPAVPCGIERGYLGMV